MPAGRPGTAEVRGLPARRTRRWFTLFRRLTEVEIHHVDLGAGYGPADWPDWFVTDELERVTGQLRPSRTTSRRALADAAAGRQSGSLRPGRGAAATVTGPGCRVLAWLPAGTTAPALTSGGQDRRAGHAPLPND